MTANRAKASRMRGMYKEITIDGEPCYQKFRAAGVDQDCGGGRNGGKIFGGGGKLVGGTARAARW